MSVIWESKRDIGDRWIYACGDITGYLGEIVLEIRATRGGGPLGDIGIDDVGITDNCRRKSLLLYEQVTSNVITLYSHGVQVCYFPIHFFLKMGHLIKKNKICSHWSQFFRLREELILDVSLYMEANSKSQKLFSVIK